MRKPIVAFLLLLLALAPALRLSAQDTNMARLHIRRLSSPNMYGRAAAHRGDSIAAEYIRKALKTYGLFPLGKNYYQDFTISTRAVEGKCRISFDDKTLVPYTDYRFATHSASFVSLLGIRPLQRVPIAVLTDTVKLKKYLKKHRESLNDAIIYIDASKATAEERKAVNDLHNRNPFGNKILIIGEATLSTMSPVGSDIERDYAYVEVLASKVPKRVNDVNIEYHSTFIPAYKTQNVCAMIHGEVDTMVVFTAHYDHLGQMGDEVIFPGAHDNASGVAALLELARMSSTEKPHYTLVFMFFSGEEMGLKGAQYAANNPLIGFRKVRLLVNIDLFCGGDEGLMVFNAEDKRVQPFVDRLKRLNDALTIAPELRLRPNRPNSDHYPFTNLCPSIYILTMGGPYGGYHSPDDRHGKCGLANFSNYLTLISSLAF